MRKILLCAALLAVSAVPVVAQNGGYLGINNNGFNANTADIDVVTATGKLSRLTTISTHGVGTDGGFPSETQIAVAKNLKCLWISDPGSGDVASFELPSLKWIGSFSDPSLEAFTGLGLAQAGNYLITGWSYSSAIAILKVNNDCTLTLVGTPFFFGATISALRATPDGKVVVVSDGEGGEVQAYSVSTEGALTPIGQPLNFSYVIPACKSVGCAPTGVDVTADGKYWVWGNPTPVGASTLTATLDSSGFSNPALQQYPSSGLVGVENAWFSPAGRAGNGNLYLGAFGNDISGYGAGIIVTTFNNGTITYASATANSAAFYAGNVQTIGSTGTGSPITQIWSDSNGNNTVNTYTVSGTALVPVSSLKTSSSSGSFAYSTVGAGH